MESSTNLGRVSLVPRGSYDPTAIYTRLDILEYSGSSFLALRNVQGVTPTEGADYMLLARKGARGEDGNGAGDMLARIYDPQGMSRDIFAYSDALMPIIYALILLKTSWTGSGPYTQTCTVPGILADESIQIIHTAPASENVDAWDNFGVSCTSQGENTLIFSSQELPNVNIQIYVAVQMGVAPGEDALPSTPNVWQQALEKKQDKLTGLPGQVVGFDETGNAVPQNATPSGSGSDVGSGSGGAWNIGHGLAVVEGKLTVDTTDDFMGDNTLPMSAAGVQTVVGNINVLLGTI